MPVETYQLSYLNKIPPALEILEDDSEGGEYQLNLSIKMTDQKYGLVRDLTTQTPQTAQNGPQSPQLSDDRISVVDPEQISVNKDVYDAQTRLLSLVDEFLISSRGVTPTEAINELLLQWLTTPAALLSYDRNREKLETVLALVSFLSKLKVDVDNANYLTESAQKEGVLYGQQQ